MNPHDALTGAVNRAIANGAPVYVNQPADAGQANRTTNMTNILASRAMLSAVTVRQYTARKKDKKAAKEITDAHGASERSGTFIKRSIAKEALAAIVTAANAARTEHYARTLPWLDNGARVLPAAGYLAYTETMRGLRADFESAVETFLANYPSFVDDAKRELNGLFDPADYPSASEIWKSLWLSRARAADARCCRFPSRACKRSSGRDPRGDRVRNA